MKGGVNQHANPRAVTYAVGASLALHAALLTLRGPESQPPISPAAPIVAHIAEQEAAPPPAVVEPEPVRPPPKSRRPKPPPKVVRPQPAPAKPSEFTVAPAAPAPIEPAQPKSEPAPAPAPAPSVAPPGPVAVAPAAPPAPDRATLIAQYRSQFIGAAVRYKRYPLPARDNGWEGDVLVHLEIAANGELAELKVKRSSGHPVLDEQALEMFRLAAPQVPLPPALRGRAFGFDVRAVYSLKD
jgi:periplasmic protein TonB